MSGVGFCEEDQDERLADKRRASGQQQRDLRETVRPQPPEPLGDLATQVQARGPFLPAAGLPSPDQRQRANGDGEREGVYQEGKNPPEAEQEPAQRTAHQNDHVGSGFAAGRGPWPSSRVSSPSTRAILMRCGRAGRFSPTSAMPAKRCVTSTARFGTTGLRLAPPVGSPARS